MLSSAALFEPFFEAMVLTSLKVMKQNKSLFTVYNDAAEELRTIILNDDYTYAHSLTPLKPLRALSTV